MLTAAKALEYTLNPIQKCLDDELEGYKTRIEKAVGKAISRKEVWVEVDDINDRHLEKLLEWLKGLGYSCETSFSIFHYYPHSIKIMWDSQASSELMK